ncbi:MAG: polysaccharide biosynthesis protein [Nitrospiraceae bacterium]|nr:polysaccharide biosynthesis protein [Nitrospiraceae bacterium]
MSSVLSGKISVQDLRDVAVEDLLGREPVAPQAHLLALSITTKVVMITGAGGSIGSELARQAIKLLPRQLILVDISEVALFAIQQELLTAIADNANSARSTELVAELCNCTDREPIARVMALYRPDTVFHAAAYKHVPMLEANPLSAARNNIFGTWATAAAASAQAVERFVLVSTDKAVRPTNIMGASKRLARLTLQSIASEHANAEQSTRFCMVRFGNVLASSGSVIPKFQQQIQAGGPITLTHPEITRYFMTIPEAAQLVIQAAALNTTHTRGAPVYLLDMGESVKIVNLAKMLIQLSGLSVRDEANPNGDIAINITPRRRAWMFSSVVSSLRPAKIGLS